MKVTKVASALGAIIEDADPRDPDLDFDAVYHALLEHQVIFFPGVGLNDEEHLEFGKRFGTPSIFPVARLMGMTEPTLTRIEDEEGQRNVADAWHTDVTWTQKPPKAALLTMDLIPEIGGDTVWGSATLAFDDLDDPMKAFLSGLTCIHDNEGFIASLIEKVGDRDHELVGQLRKEYPPVVHPLIRTHPETGKKAIMYAARFMRGIPELSELASRHIIEFLGEHLKDPRYHCRWSWSDGDMAVWDERSTVHRAAADHFPHRRIIRRLEIDGDRPI